MTEQKSSSDNNNKLSLNDDEDSFSSDSDDEFLTMRDDGKGSLDREALIRKKLLESFYGKTGDDDDNNDDDSSRSSSSNDNKNNKTNTNKGSNVVSDNDDIISDDDNSSRSRSDRNKNNRNVMDDNNNNNNTIQQQQSMNDLDSPYFNSKQHTTKHVINSTVHNLLETEENLACQVRTLDSTMQTLVYENYSRFIDATDAIRSIGINVEANENGLIKLVNGMNIIHNKSMNVERNVGILRDNVVEKLRVKRLLYRLDTLLKLPTTLTTQINVGKYRYATKSYLSAYSILSKHSDGFESLKTIEMDCYSILSTMLINLKYKLIHWSGNIMSFDDNDNNNNNEQLPPDPPKTMAEVFECAGTPVLILDKQQEQEQEQSNIDDGTMPTTSSTTTTLHPDLTAEECKEMALAASLRLLERTLDTHHIELQEMIRQHYNSNNNQQQQQQQKHHSHHVDLDESMDTTTTSQQQQQKVGSSNLQLIPTHVLDSILQASTLYSMSFGKTIDNGNNNSTIIVEEHDRERLSEFVSEAFSSFLQHVRNELLEYSLYIQQRKELHNNNNKKNNNNNNEMKEENESNNNNDKHNMRTLRIARSYDSTESNSVLDNDNNDDDDDNLEEEEESYEQISNAMTILLQSVRQLASGLALPEVGLDMEIASSLVDQTTNLTEAMVRRRVDQKFYSLRFRIIKDCLEPFCLNAMEYENNEDEENNNNEHHPARVLQVVQMASVALSDSLQLVDDTVRSILSTTTTSSSSSSLSGNSSSSGTTGADTVMIKQAVETSTRRFAMWLATAIEILAGCESSDPKWTIDATNDIHHEQDTNNDDDNRGGNDNNNNQFDSTTTTNNLTGGGGDDDVSEVSGGGGGGGDDPNSTTTQLLEIALFELSEEIEATRLKTARSDITLALAEMCRVAERSVMDNINQSIATHGGGNYMKQKHRKTKAGLFPSGGGGGADDGGQNYNNNNLLIDNNNNNNTFITNNNKNNNKNKNNPTSQRFRLAASRILGLYAMNRGNDAAQLLCFGLNELTHDNRSNSNNNNNNNNNNNFGDHNNNTFPDSPRVATWQVLELVKLASYDCADIFGGSKRAGPIPQTLEDEYSYPTGTGGITGGGGGSVTSSGGQGGQNSLIFDVERMFTEQIIIYPHPKECIEFTRNVVLTIILKVAFKAFIEYIRLISTFSNNGYQQLIIDIQFLKFLIPHYVKDELLSEGCNARTLLLQLLTDSMTTIQERYHNNNYNNNDYNNNYYNNNDPNIIINQARAVIRDFMTNNDGPHGLVQRFIISED